MPKLAKTEHFSLGEEIANSIIHGLGALLAVSALVIMVVFSSLYGDILHVVSCSIFGVTLVAMYLSSTLYHGIQHQKTKKIFMVLDHISIYLLIAGTYTPFTLIAIRGPWGYSLFGVVWGLAFLGIILQIKAAHKWKAFRVSLYILMGWLVVLATKPILANIPIEGVWLIVAGGMAYMFGVLFYIWRWFPYHHAIWHILVIAGSTFHFCVVLFYIIPKT